MRLSFLLLLQGAASRWPLSRVEIGGKPPGHLRATAPQWGVRRRRKWQVNVKVVRAELPPGAPRWGSIRSGRRLHSGRLWLQRIPLNFRLTRKESSAKSPHGFFWRFRCSRWRLSYFAFPPGEGGRALARSDEVPTGHSGSNPTNIRKVPEKLVFCRFFARKSLTIQAWPCMMEHDFRLLLEVDSFDE